LWPQVNRGWIMNIETIKKAADNAFYDFGQFLIESKADMNVVIGRYIEYDIKMSKIENYLESYDYEYLNHYVDLLRRYIADCKAQELGYKRDSNGQWISDK